MPPVDLGTAVNRHSWEWLFDVACRLNVGIEIIDQQYAPVLDAGSGHAAAEARRLLAEEPSLRRLIADAIESTLPQELAAADQLAMGFPLAPTGVLLLTRQLTAHESADQGRHDLELIGPWLKSAIEIHLASRSREASAEQCRIASILRLLGEAVSRGFVPYLVGAFVEALGAWDDIDVRAYIAGECGRWLQYVTAVGADPAAMPSELDGNAIPDENRVRRLSPAEARRLGFATAAKDVLVKRIGTESGASWLMVFSGTIENEEEARLTLFCDMLREALNDLTHAAANRVVAAITRHQLSVEEPLETTARSILDEMTTAVRGREAALVVTTAAGLTPVAVGNTELLPATVSGRASPDRLVVPMLDGEGLTALLVAADYPFTPHERAILQAAIAEFHSWVRGKLQRSGKGERRGRAGSVVQTFDQLAAETVQADGRASMIVISMSDSALRPGVLQVWLANVRRELRPTDFVGILSLSEIAVLLSDTPEDGAISVSARLKKLLETHDSAGAVIQPSVGIITCSSQSSFHGSIVGAARADAAARSPRSIAQG